MHCLCLSIQLIHTVPPRLCFIVSLHCPRITFNKNLVVWLMILIVHCLLQSSIPTHSTFGIVINTDVHIWAVIWPEWWTSFRYLGGTLYWHVFNRFHNVIPSLPAAFCSFMSFIAPPYFSLQDFQNYSCIGGVVHLWSSRSSHMSHSSPPLVASLLSFFLLHHFYFICF